MAVFLYIPNIKGGATEKNHEGWVKVDSLQFGVGRHLNDPYGHASSRETGFPKVSEVHFYDLETYLEGSVSIS